MKRKASKVKKPLRHKIILIILAVVAGIYILIMTMLFLIFKYNWSQEGAAYNKRYEKFIRTNRQALVTSVEQITRQNLDPGAATHLIASAIPEEEIGDYYEDYSKSGERSVYSAPSDLQFVRYARDTCKYFGWNGVVKQCLPEMDRTNKVRRFRVYDDPEFLHGRNNEVIYPVDQNTYLVRLRSLDESNDYFFWLKFPILMAYSLTLQLFRP